MHRIPDLISGKAASALAGTCSPAEGLSNPFLVDNGEDTNDYMPHDRGAAALGTKGQDPDGEGGITYLFCVVGLDPRCQRCFIFGLARLDFIPLETLGCGIDFGG